jgi:hypothetical protein
VTGKLLAINGTTLLLSTRTSATVSIDASRAFENERVARLVVGHAYTVSIAPSLDKATMMEAEAVMRAKPRTSSWPEDRW